MKLPLKIEIPVFDLRIDRNIEKIHFYIELREFDFTYYCELFCDRHPETQEGEFEIKEGVFVYRKFIGERKNICGIDVIYEVSEIDSQYDCFELYVEQTGVGSECTLIKLPTMEKASEIQDILVKYMREKNQSDAAERSVATEPQ